LPGGLRLLQPFLRIEPQQAKNPAECVQLSRQRLGLLSAAIGVRKVERACEALQLGERATGVLKSSSIAAVKARVCSLARVSSRAGCPRKAV
jgi:hypothetical protein